MGIEKVLIIGGVAGGASAATRLRRLKENLHIILIERGEYISFANCGLPYYIGGVIQNRAKLLIQSVEGMKRRYNIEARVQQEVIRIDRSAKQVEIRNLVTNEVYSESYDKLILSPGAEPIRPNFIKFHLPSVFSLRNVPDSDRIKEYINKTNPKNALIVGGGYIGLEMLENLYNLGLSVSLVEMADQILPHLDPDMAAIIEKKLRSKGINYYLGQGVSSIQGEGHKARATLQSGQEIDFDLAIVGIGVRPEIHLAKEAGLEIGLSGGIKVDEFLVTSDPDILALGDAIEVVDSVTSHTTLIPLAGPASRQGRIAANNLMGDYERYPGTQGTSILKFFDLSVASTGNNEKNLHKRDIPYLASFTHSPSHATYYPKPSLITIKLLFSPTDGKILGAQIIGESGVDKRIDVLATSLRAGLTVYDLKNLELAYAPPYSSSKDPINIAGYVAENILLGKMNIIHGWELKESENEAWLLDVRTETEFANGHIPRANNIPIDELRLRINEVPQNRKIVVYCQVGLRAYLGCRILLQNGFKDVVNLSGGYQTYSSWL